MFSGLILVQTVCKFYKRGVCRPLEEESSFCLGLSTRPVSEIVPVCLNPRFFSSHYFVVMRFLEK